LSGRSTTFLLSMTCPRAEVSLRSSGVTRDRDGVGLLTDLELQIQADGFSCCELYALTSHRPEAVELESKPIQTGCESVHDRAAVRSGDRSPRQVRSNCRDRHAGPRHHGAGLIRDAGDERAGAHLS
jgi:hypothetical protein